MALKTISKTFILIGTVTSGLIGLGVVGGAIYKYSDPWFTSHAEADNKYLKKVDYKIDKAEDTIAVIESNIGRMEGTVAMHKIAIAEGKDNSGIHASEIIRIEGRIRDEERRMRKKQAFIKCVDEGRSHC